jgi:hypothetical protein
MTARLVGLACVLAVVGCTRNQTRRDPLRRQALPAIPPTHLPDAAADPPAQAFERPTPPAPPPLPLAGKPAARGQLASAPVDAVKPLQVATGTPAQTPDDAVKFAIRQEQEQQAEEYIRRPGGEPKREATTTFPTTVPVKAVVPSEPSPADRAKQLIDAAKKRYAGVTDYECRLVKREVVNGRPTPPEESHYKFRKVPLSVSMKVLSEAGQGREVIFVQGRDEGAMHVVTGKGDSWLAGVGYKTTVDPDGRDATSKSRYRIYQAGFGRTLEGLETAARRGFEVKAVGPVQRPEWPYPLECVTVTATDPGDPTLPPGGKRSIFFDPKPDSPTHGLPVLTEMRDAGGQEIEYYSFDRFKLPAGLTDADFDPARMGKQR